MIRAVKVFPEVSDGLNAILVRRADGEAPLHLTGEFAGCSSRSLTEDQKVIGLPSQALGLEADLGDNGVDQDRWEAAHQELRQPIRPDVLLEGCAGTSSRGRTRHTRCCVVGSRRGTTPGCISVAVLSLHPSGVLTCARDLLISHGIRGSVQRT